MHKSFLYSAVAFFALVVTPAIRAESGSFQVAENGHAVGTASFNFAPNADGYVSTSIVRVAMQGLDYSLSKTEELTSANQLRHAQLSAVVNNSAVTVVVAPDSAQLLLNMSANGLSTTTRLASHSSAILLPDFDPGALETLLALAVTQSNRDVWAIIPKQAGSVESVQVATYADEQGTLDNKPITVHHLVATIAGASTDLFSGPENQLLQAELPQAGFALIRDGFVLNPPAKAPAAPQAPQSSDQSLPPSN